MDTIPTKLKRFVRIVVIIVLCVNGSRPVYGPTVTPKYPRHRQKCHGRVNCHAKPTAIPVIYRQQKDRLIDVSYLAI